MVSRFPWVWTSEAYAGEAVAPLALSASMRVFSTARALLIRAVSSSVLYFVNSLAYALASRVATAGLRSFTPTYKTSEVVDGWTEDSPSIRPGVSPGTPAAATTRVASSGERAMLA